MYSPRNSCEKQPRKFSRRTMDACDGDDSCAYWPGPTRVHISARLARNTQIPPLGFSTPHPVCVRMAVATPPHRREGFNRGAFATRIDIGRGDQ